MQHFLKSGIVLFHGSIFRMCNCCVRNSTCEKTLCEKNGDDIKQWSADPDFTKQKKEETKLKKEDGPFCPVIKSHIF